MAESRINNGKKGDARERARQRRLAAESDRVQRDERIEEALAGFIEASDAHEELSAKLAELERAMGAQLDAIASEGESNARISALAGVEVREVGRLRKLSDTTPASPGETGQQQQFDGSEGHHEAAPAFA